MLGVLLADCRRAWFFFGSLPNEHDSVEVVVVVTVVLLLEERDALREYPEDELPVNVLLGGADETEDDEAFEQAEEIFIAVGLIYTLDWVE